MPDFPGRGQATTIGVVATDAPLDKPQCRKLAQMAQDGLARAIDPAHTMLDGDTLFALSTAGASAPRTDLTLLGTAAAHAVSAAVRNAILAATGVVAGSLQIPAFADR